MRWTVLGLYLMALAALATPPARADLSSAELPDQSVWYFQVDLQQMRQSPAGSRLYAWLDKEVFNEIRDEAGIDLNKEANQVTAFSVDGAGIALVIDGPISQDSQDKILALAAVGGDFKTFKSSGKTLYFFEKKGDIQSHDGSVQIDADKRSAWFSFAVKDKLLVSSTREQLEAMLANNGKVAGTGSHKNALFVLSAQRSFVQAGMRADAFRSKGNDWDSNILKNTEQVAMLVADAGEQIAIEARLTAVEPDMANALASIVRGLIGLQALSDDVPPNLSKALQSAKIDVDDRTMRIRLNVDPDVVLAAIDK